MSTPIHQEVFKNVETTEELNKTTEELNKRTQCASLSSESREQLTGSCDCVLTQTYQSSNLHLVRSGRSPVKVAKSHSQFFFFFPPAFHRMCGQNIFTLRSPDGSPPISSFSVVECSVTQIPLWSFNGIPQLMRYGKWHIEHITLPHAARVGLDNLSAETHAAHLSNRVFLFVCVSTSRKVQRCSTAKPAERTQEGFQRSGFSGPNVGHHATW